MSAALSRAAAPLAPPRNAPPRRLPPRHLPAWRVHMLRVPYALIAFLMGPQSWASLATAASAEPAHGIVRAMLAALSLLALLGLFRPLRMLPLMLWEVAWKVIWLAAVAWPRWQAGTLDGDYAENAFACGLIGIVILMMPWDFIAARLLRRPAACVSGA